MFELSNQVNQASFVAEAAEPEMSTLYCLSAYGWQKCLVVGAGFAINSVKTSASIVSEKENLWGDLDRKLVLLRGAVDGEYYFFNNRSKRMFAFSLF